MLPQEGPVAPEPEPERGAGSQPSVGPTHPQEERKHTGRGGPQSPNYISRTVLSPGEGTDGAKQRREFH